MRQRLAVHLWVATLGLALAGAGPAPAFEIFGITLFGGGEDEAQVEIIDPQAYEVRFDVAGDDTDLRKALARSSALWTNRKTPASGVAGLVAAARGDYRALLATLYSEGFYAGAISIRIDGEEAASRSLTDELGAVAQVVVRVDPGPPFRFGQARYTNAPPDPGSRFDRVDRSARNAFVTGRRARAGVVTAAGDEAVSAWRQAGYPKARVAGREVIADHATTELDVEIRLDPGRAATFGAVSVTGSGKVDPEFVAYMAGLPTGRPFDPDTLERSTDRLTDLRVFRAVNLREADEVQPDGSLPITIETLPRLPRRYGFGGTLSSTEGLGLEAFWLHRNLFGRAERLRFDASISGIGTTGDYEDYDYRFAVGFTKPGVLNPDINLESEIAVSQDVFDTYRERRVGGRLGLSRRFTREVVGSGFLDLSYASVTDDAGQRDFLTLGLPLAVTFDARDDSLEPTRGMFASLEIKPFQEFEFNTSAVRAELEGRAYFKIVRDRTVLATRAKYGAVFGGTLSEISPGELFFTGGGGSIRGFEYRANGLTVGGNTVGGRSALEFSAELRQRIGERYGVVAFADSGIVSAETFPQNRTSLRMGVGAGIRYYSGLGPLRFDIAAPVDRRSGEPAFAFYIGIGQAF